MEQKLTSAVQDIAWSPDGRRIVSVSDAANRGVQVWDAANGGHLYLFTGHLDKVGTVCWSPDGRYIATGGADVDDSTVQVWRDQTGTGS